MAGLCQVTLIGNMGRDPEMRYLSDGKAVTSFSCAVNSGSGDNQKTTWFEVVAWERLAEIVNQYGTKGRQVWLQGPVELNEYETKSGEHRATMKVTAHKFILLGSKEEGARREKPATSDKDAWLTDDEPF